MVPHQHVKEMKLYLAWHTNNNNSFCCVSINIAVVALQKIKTQANKLQDIWDQLLLLLRSVERFLLTLMSVDDCKIRIDYYYKCHD